MSRSFLSGGLNLNNKQLIKSIKENFLFVFFQGQYRCLLPPSSSKIHLSLYVLPSSWLGKARPLKLMLINNGGGGLVAKSCLTLATLWTVACQAPLFMGFCRQEYWSGLPFPSLGNKQAQCGINSFRIIN